MTSLTCIRLLATMLGSVASAAAMSFTEFHLTVTETFDTLAASGSSGLLPAGWSMLETGSGANATYTASTGSASTGNTYSFGASGGTERALGAVRSSSVAAVWGVWATNATGAMLAGLDVAYMGEQWRLGATGRADRVDFAYSLDATALGNGRWVDVDELDFVAPVTSGAIGAMNGNAAANRVGRSYTLGGLALPPGAGLMLRWSDFDASGADDGLAIDEVVLTARPVKQAPVPDGLPPGAGALVLAGIVAFAVTGSRKAWK